MARTNHPKIVSIIDTKTKKEIFTSSLGNLSLAGWEAFQDPTYTTINPLGLVEGVETRIIFPAENTMTFPQFTRRPVKGAKVYPLWDFDNNVFVSYKDNRLNVYDVRLQFSARTSTAATGVAVESIIRIPNGISILRESEPLNKGTQSQRVSYRLSFYVDETTEVDGLELYLEAIGADVDIYNINLLIKSW